MEQRTERAHLTQFDLLRGAAIVAVVYLHAYFTPWPEVSSGGLTVLRVVHLVAHGAVPLFLFIAAYLQAAAPREGVVEHFRRRWWSTWLPVVVWMAATFVYRGAADGFDERLWRDFALFDVSGQFYFVWLLLVFGVALTQVWRVPGRWLPYAVAVAFAANLGTIAWYESHTEISGLFATLAYRNPLAWVFFPALGYWFGREGIAVVKTPLMHAGLAVMAAAAAVYLYFGLRHDDWPVSYFGLTVFVFSAAAMTVYPAAAAAVDRLGMLTRPLLSLSRYSFPIYLVHLPFVMGYGTEHLLGDGAAWSNYWLLLHANAAAGLLVSWALVREFDKASPWLAARLLGVRHPKRRRTARAATPAVGVATGPSPVRRP